MSTFNVRSNQKLCAFCKYWNDPTNSAISPRAPQIGSWEYDRNVEAMCIKRGIKRRSYIAGCNEYECKIPK